MKSYLLFDLDGTLTDPKAGITACVQYALDAFGIREPDLDKLESFIGPPLKDSFMKFYDMSETQAQEAVKKYRERFQDTGIYENKLYEGIPQMLRALRAKGMRLAVASSKPTVFVRRILEHFQIDGYFQAVVGSELDGARSEKAQVVEEALRQLFGEKPVEKEKAYMIGDRRYDVEGARANGIESVGVTYGYGSMEELKEAKADYIVRSVEELKKFLLRGTEDTPQDGSSWKLWPILFPILLFWVVRGLGQYAAAFLLQAAGNVLSGGSFFFVRDETGALTAFTGNAGALIDAVGFAAGAAAIWKTAAKQIAATAEDMKLLHIKAEPAYNYLLFGLLSVSAVMGITQLLNLTGVTRISQTYQAVAQDQFSASLFMGLLCYGLVTPFAEELLFRGAVYGCLRRLMKRRAAIFLSAALFGAYHLNLVQGLYGFLIGLLLVYGYEYFGDFRIPVAIHMTANVLAYALSYTSLAVSGIHTWAVCAGFLALAAVSFALLRRQKRI